jgi:hypothetical protein
VVGNSAPADGDCAQVNGSGLILTARYNLLGEGSGCPVGSLDVTVADVGAVLGPLADNGGPTQSHALVGGTNPPATGVSRPGAWIRRACPGAPTSTGRPDRPRSPATSAPTS